MDKIKEELTMLLGRIEKIQTIGRANQYNIVVAKHLKQAILWCDESLNDGTKPDKPDDKPDKS